MTPAPLLAVDGVSKQFPVVADGGLRALLRRGRSRPSRVIALDDVRLELDRGEILGVVGESGCGKSTLARIVTGLSAPTAGIVRFRGDDVGGLPAPQRLAYTLAVQMIFQNPFAALNPRHRVARIVGEAPVAHGLVAPADAGAYVADQLVRVGLAPHHADRYPHEFSGGQRQRIGIARALAVQPEVLVCDEVVSALDVSIQAQILNLLLDLRERLGLTAMFISHDLGVVRYLCDRVAVMYLGRVVELASAADFFAAPAHPYGSGLLAEIPAAHAGKRQFRPIRGEIASPLAPPSGCHFHPRCPQAMERCRREAPKLVTIAPMRKVACHLHDTMPQDSCTASS